ncbi:MAG: hypothetical protein HC869_16360 [Rhodospirillales bacterium]|nr:hypothetical protein [Rhodospirillales bacterium]
MREWAISVLLFFAGGLFMFVWLVPEAQSGWRAAVASMAMTASLLLAFMLRGNGDKT